MSRISSALLLCIISFSLTAQAQSGRSWGSGFDFTQRAAKREQSRWSLSEWMEMKSRNSMMDAWLSMNSPSPYEFMLGAVHNSASTEIQGGSPSATKTSFGAEFAAYAQFVGLSGEYENNTEDGYNDLSGMLNIRILGNSIQNTALTLHYGQRTREHSGADGRISQQFAQGSLQIYLTKYFGIDGKYRHYLPTSTEAMGDVEGNLSEAGLFIDFKAIRIYGSWFKDTQIKKIPASTDETITNRTGIKSGIKIFF